MSFKKWGSKSLVCKGSKLGEKLTMEAIKKALEIDRKRINALNLEMEQERVRIIQEYWFKK